MDTSTALEPSPPSSPSSSSSSSNYDVFLSYSGEDTRKTFTDHLYWTMKDAGIDFFMEESESIRREENISEKVKQIIEGSRVSVIVFSSSYADSIWCLEELVQIMECRRTLKQMVLPIFYELSPSDAIDTFAQALQKHRTRFYDTDKQEKIKRWTDALTEVADLAAWVFSTTNGYEGMFIRKIIDEIARQLKSPTPVGIDFPELQRIDHPELQRNFLELESPVSGAKPPLSRTPFKKTCHEHDHSDDMPCKFSDSESASDSNKYHGSEKSIWLKSKSPIRGEGGDWICTSCAHLNFQRRSSCQRCGDPKSEEKVYGSFGGGRSGGGGGSFGFTTGPDVHPGDWYCTTGNCAAHNFASRSSCFKCGAIKDELSSSGGFEGDMPRLRRFGFSSGGRSSGRSGWKHGDWICPRSGCNGHNFAVRTECFRCNAPRESNNGEAPF